MSYEKRASHEHVKCARRRGENAVFAKSLLKKSKSAFRVGESVIFENVHAVEARTPFWPFENSPKTEGFLAFSAKMSVSRKRNERFQKWNSENRKWQKTLQKRTFHV